MGFRLPPYHSRGLEGCCLHFFSALRGVASIMGSHPSHRTSPGMQIHSGTPRPFSVH